MSAHQKSANKPSGSQQIYIGPAGWSYPDWKRILYPEPRPKGFHEATFLAEFFNTIEINTSFYHPMQPAHAEQWIERVAANPKFLFTAKLWRNFTHDDSTTAADVALVRAGFDILQNARRLGAMLLQFPFSFHHTPETMKRLTLLLDQFHDYPLVVEVRHASWAKKEFYDFLHQRRVGFCNIDQPVIGRSIVPSERVTSPIGYVRLHGRRYDTWFSDDPDSPPSERYNYLYSAAELEPWAKRIEHVAETADKTFVVTNNHFQAKGIVNALELMNLLSGQKVKVPEPLRSHYPQLESIADAPAKEPTLFPLLPKQ
jgi:uncharacterized protein YecE (DUF72 family)